MDTQSEHQPSDTLHGCVTRLWLAFGEMARRRRAIYTDCLARGPLRRKYTRSAELVSAASLGWRNSTQRLQLAAEIASAVPFGLLSPFQRQICKDGLSAMLVSEGENQIKDS